MDTEDKKEFDLLKNKKALFIILIVIAIITIFIVFIMNNDSEYKSLEESMLATTKNYVKTGKIDFEEQYYFTISQMGIKESYDCSRDSGVNIKKENGNINYEIYLICDSYKSENMKSTNSKYIEVIGANPLIVENNTAFVDPGYKSNGYVVEETSNFKNTPGVYTVSYHVYSGSEKKETVNRYVIVSNVASADAPVITLNGDSNVVVKVGGNYIEPGYFAIDPTDGTITNKVTKNSNVNTNVIGEYEIVYHVTNSKGLTSTKKRMVSVIDKDLNIVAKASLSPEIATKDKVTINLSITGDTYSYTILPDKSKVSENKVKYEVNENDLYTFKIYDKYGNSSDKKVFVDTIDRIPPTGTCNAVSQGGVVTYTVNGEDESGIKGYSYYLGTGYSEYTSANTFKYTFDYNSANVMIQDVAGNITKVSCSGKKISTITSASIPTEKTIYIGDNYTIPVTITPSNANKNEIYFDIESGNNYVSLTDGVVKGVTVGTSVIRMRVTDSEIEQRIKIIVKKKAASTWTPDPSDPSQPASWCGKHAATLTAYYNGSELADKSTIRMHVGETVRITVYLTKDCGTIKKLTRTSASGETSGGTGGCTTSDPICWRNWFTATSVPSVSNDDPSTYVSTDHFDWVITATKSSNGKTIELSQTTFQSTSKFSEIKGFFHLNVKID